MTLQRQKITPFVRWEEFYDTRTSAWSKHRYYAGVSLPLTKEVSTELFYVREDNDFSRPHIENIAGVSLQLYFGK